MTDGYRQLKNRYARRAFIISSVCALLSGLFASGAVLIAYVAAKSDIKAWLCVLAGIAAAAAVFAVLLLSLYPFNRKFAKTLDGKFGLGERVRTMLAYSGSSDEMAVLQRADADERIRAVPPVKFGAARLTALIVAAVLSVGVFVTPLCLTSKKSQAEVQPPVTEDPEIPPEEPADPDDAPWTYTLELQSQMADLKWNIEDSELKKETDREYVLTYVWGALDSELREVATVGEMKRAVISKIQVLDSYVSNCNTFLIIGGALKTAEEGSDVLIGETVYKGVGAYTDTGLNFSTFSQVSGVNAQLARKIESALAPLDTYAEKCRTDRDMFENKMTSVGGNIKTALSNVNVADNDALLTDIIKFKDTIDAIADKCGKGYNITNLQTEMVTAFADLKKSLITSLKPQSYRCMFNIFLRRSLAEIFGVPLAEIGEVYQDLKSEGGASGDTPGGSGGSGGYGTGDATVGSDDLVYNPLTGEYVKFGDLIAEYEDKMAEAKQKLPPELVNYLEEYLNILYNGIPNNEENNNDEEQ